MTDFNDSKFLRTVLYKSVRRGEYFRAKLAIKSEIRPATCFFPSESIMLQFFSLGNRNTLKIGTSIVNCIWQAGIKMKRVILVKRIFESYPSYPIKLICFNLIVETKTRKILRRNGNVSWK